jgi:hypothetical protein
VGGGNGRGDWTGHTVVYLQLKKITNILTSHAASPFAGFEIRVESRSRGSRL